MHDFLGMGLIIKEQRAEIERLKLENQLLFEHIKGNADDLARFNRALETVRANGRLGTEK